MTYNKEYYKKNREKLISAQKEYQKKHYKGLGEDNSLRIRALKAWRTRRKKNEKRN